MSIVEDVLSNSNGLIVKTISLGATITSVQLPNGTRVVLGFKDLEVYRRNPPYFGCTVGRCTNRIAGSRFSIDGTEYKVSNNVEGTPHSLHGGEKGFNKYEWTCINKTDRSVTYELVSQDGDQGYPGTVTARATYTVNDSNQVIIEYSATTDKPTVINLTNHTYFNLAGNGQPIYDHVLTLNADGYTLVDDCSIPTGEIASVSNTVMDFTTPHTIGERYENVPGSKVGYDHNYCLNTGPTFSSDESLRLAGKLDDPSTGNSLVVYTDQPCTQLYMGGYLDQCSSIAGLDDKPIQKYSGVCLETQIHPDAVNQPNFPSTVFRPGQTYSSKTIWEFSSSK